MDTKAKKKENTQIPPYIKKHFTKHSRSNRSIRAYCEQAGISPLTFYTWRKRYKTEGRPSPERSISSPRLSFTTLGPFSTTQHLCDISLPSGITVLVHRGASVQELSPIITLLTGSGIPSC